MARMKFEDWLEEVESMLDDLVPTALELDSFDLDLQELYELNCSIPSAVRQGLEAYGWSQRMIHGLGL